MFCRYCGNKVLEEAYMCPSCRNMLKALPTQENVPTLSVAPTSSIQEIHNAPSLPTEQKASSDPHKYKAMIFSIIGIALSVQQILLIGPALAMINSISYFTDSGDQSIAFLFAFVGVLLLAGGFYLGFLYPVSFGMGIAGFCLGRKTENSVIRKLSMAALVLSLIAGVFVGFLWTFILGGGL